VICVGAEIGLAFREETPSQAKQKQQHNTAATNPLAAAVFLRARDFFRFPVRQGLACGRP
jgi:hypothetical protein